MAAKKKDSGFEPFKRQEREKACELLAKAAIDLERARQSVKDKKTQFDKLRDAIQRGGYLDEAQLELGAPRTHVDDVLDETDDDADTTTPMAAAQEQAKKRAAKNGAAEKGA